MPSADLETVSGERLYLTIMLGYIDDRIYNQIDRKLLIDIAHEIDNNTS